MTPGATPLDPGLVAWRDAAIRGELPQPRRTDRWVPLRAGLVNLWEYDVAEVWYADGRLQLQGANESGKSTLMTLTTLLLLAGDVSGHNIDTLGESGKRFRYYIEPTTLPLDRRDASAAKQRGWAWVEYGRITEEGPRFFTCLLFSEARRADKNLKLGWCTLSGEQRVRRGVSLVNASFVAEPGHLRDVPGFTEHRTGTAFREELARRLFETEPGWLDQLIRILRVVRTPKIGDRLDLDFLTKAFRSALPPLADDEISQLADGWEQLERLSTERDITEQALAAVTDFTRRSWRPWADAFIRAAADPVIAATSALTGITRTETAAKEAVTALGSQLEQLDLRIDDQDAEMKRAVAERDALRERQEYKDALSAMQNARQLGERAIELEALATRSEQRAADAKRAVAPAESRLSTARDQLAGAEERVTSVSYHVAAHAATAGLVDATARFLPERDTPRLLQAAVRRDEACRHALRLLDDQESAARKAEWAAASAGEARQLLAQARTRVEQATSGLDTAIRAAADVLVDWVSGLDVRIRPTASMVEQWAGQVARLVDAERPDPVLGAAITRDHLTPRRRPLEQRNAELIQTLAATSSETATVERELTAIEAETDPRPEPPNLWRRRDRADGITAEGAPFWRLVEVDGGLDPEAVARLEAALEAAGLLQAWVTPDGGYLLDRDGNDAVWTAGAEDPKPRASLRDLLRPADDAGPLGGTVDRLLRTGAYGPTLPDAGTAFCADGSWRHGELTGLAAPADAGPRLLGAAARAADRARRIDDLRRRLTELAERRATLDAERAEVDGLLAALDQAAAQLPSDMLVVRAVLALRTAETQLEGAEEHVRATAEAEQAALSGLSAASAAVASHVDAHGLPPTRDDVGSVRTAIGEYTAAVRELASALTLLAPLREAVQQAQDTLESYVEAAKQAAEDAEKDLGQASNARARADAAQAALSQEGQGLLIRFTALGTAIQRYDDGLGKLSTERAGLDRQLVRAEDNLTQVEERRQDAERQRQTAIDGWFMCVDSGLPRLRDLPDPAARHVTGALESARVARANISPRDWPDDPVAALHRVQNLWARLADAVAQLRSQLEPLAGRTARTVPPGEGDDAFPGAVEVTVDGTGVAQPPPTAASTLAGLLARLQTDYDEELTKTIDQLLGSTFIEHLRDRLVEGEQLRTDINAKLAQNPTSTSGLMLRLVRQAVAEESAANQVLDALERSFKLLPDSTQEQVRQFLATRISDAQEAARAAGDPDWRTRLGEILDYRQWFELKLEYRTPQADSAQPKWHKLDRDNHALLSGGAKVVTLLQPFVAALHAMYDQSGVGPRMMWLDEAFDGVDPDNRSTMLRLLTACDLDWLIAGPGPIANAATVPAAAMYEVRRAPRPAPGVSLELAVWSGNQLTHLATPDPADLPDLARTAAAEPADDLFAAAESS